MNKMIVLIMAFAGLGGIAKGFAADETLKVLKNMGYIQYLLTPEDQISGIPVDKNRYIWRYKNSVPCGFQFDEGRDYLYPIPTRALTLNKNLKQNPGWGE